MGMTGGHTALSGSALHPSVALRIFEANAGAQRHWERQHCERHGFVASNRTDGEGEENLPDILFDWRRA